MTQRAAHPLLIVFALWLLVFSASSQIMIISPILPQIGEELSIQEAILGTLVTAYSIALGLFAIISGPISDKIGRRRILLLGTGTMSVALAFHVVVTGYSSFLLVRVLAGMAGGVLTGSAVSYIGDFFPYNRRGWATGWVMSGSAAGQIIGIPLGVALAGAYGFKAPFYLFAVTMGLTFILIWARVPQPDVKRTRGRLTVRRVAINYWSLLRRRDVAAASAAFFLMYLGVSLFVVYLPTWLEEDLGATPNAIATLFMVGGVANVLAGPQAGKVSDRVGRKGIVMASCIALSVVMVLTTPLVRAFWVAYPLFFVTMVLVAMRMSPFSALLTGMVEDERRGSLLSLTVALGNVGFGLGGAVAGPFYAGFGYGSNTVIGAIAVMAMGVIVWFFVPEPEEGSVARNSTSRDEFVPGPDEGSVERTVASRDEPGRAASTN